MPSRGIEEAGPLAPACMCVRVLQLQSLARSTWNRKICKICESWTAPPAPQGEGHPPDNARLGQCMSRGSA